MNDESRRRPPDGRLRAAGLGQGGGEAVFDGAADGGAVPAHDAGECGQFDQPGLPSPPPPASKVRVLRWMSTISSNGFRQTFRSVA